MLKKTPFRPSPNVRLHPPPFEAMNRGLIGGCIRRPLFGGGRDGATQSGGSDGGKVRTAKPGRYGDGAGLYLLVRGPEARFWLFRYTREGKMREMGLGAASGRLPFLWPMRG